ncbi:MAG: 4-fold beta flower protein [Candidatus Nomurabacteria bacterium]
MNNKNNYTFIFKSDGRYLGFVFENNLFSRDGEYLGWIEGNFAWDKNGNFRGITNEINGHIYIFINKFSIPPIKRIPKLDNIIPVIPPPQQNILPIRLQIEFQDGF